MTFDKKPKEEASGNAGVMAVTVAIVSLSLPSGSEQVLERHVTSEHPAVNWVGLTGLGAHQSGRRKGTPLDAVDDDTKALLSNCTL